MTAPLTRPRNSSVAAARPMFQVLRDDSQTCSCHVISEPGAVCNFTAMRVTADEYDRADRWFL